MTADTLKITSPKRRTHPWPDRRLWPGYVCAAGLLVYAVEKAYYATQGRLGIPGGPHVPDSAYQQLGHVAARQWTLATVGLAAALLALATVLPIGRRPGWPLPRWLLLTGLWAAVVPMVAGAPYVVRAALDEGAAQAGGLLRSALVLLLWLAMTWSFQVRSRATR
jgi:hypothetical protein